MIDYGQYAVKASALREAYDQVHHDLGERGCVFGDSDFVKWGAGFVHEVLVLLADGAPFYILFNPRSCSGPEIVAVDLSGCLVSSSVPPRFVVVPHS